MIDAGAMRSLASPAKLLELSHMEGVPRGVIRMVPQPQLMRVLVLTTTVGPLEPALVTVVSRWCFFPGIQEDVCFHQ